MRFSFSQMLNRIQTRTGVVTVVSLMLIVIYHLTSTKNKNHFDSQNYNDLSGYSKELNELRHNMNDLKRKVYHIEQTLSSSTFSSSIISCIQTIFSHFTYLSSSFILYTFILYISHICIFNRSTTQTIKLLHIVNIISYTLISIFYTSFSHFHYSNLAWLLLVLLFVRVCIH